MEAVPLKSQQQGFEQELAKESTASDKQLQPWWKSWHSFQQHLRNQDRAVKATVITVTVILGAVLLITAIAEAAEGDEGDVVLTAACSQPQGGGLVQAGRLMTASSLQLNPKCAKQLAGYYYADDDEHGGWLEDVARTTTAMQSLLSAQPITAYTSTSTSSSAAGVPTVVFDIDETALSNLAYLGVNAKDHGNSVRRVTLLPYARRRLLSSSLKPASDISPAAVGTATVGQHTHRRHLTGDDDDNSDDSDGDLSTTGKLLPAVQPVLDLYNSLQRMGFAVAFVTNRRESFRAVTVQNLAAAGYGSQCSSSSSSSSGTLAGSPATGAPSPDPCWAQLLMRPDNDTRLSSELKPELRAALQGQGYAVVATLGDQMSDLTGPYTPPLVFKLPNLLYYTL